MRFKHWLANEELGVMNTNAVKAPSQNPTMDNRALTQAVQATLQDPTIPNIVAQNPAPQQLTKSLIPVAQNAIKKSPLNRGTTPLNVTPMDVMRAALPQLQMSKPSTMSGQPTV